jgi:hypothetical protein
LDLRIGIHTSTAGSLERSAVKAHELGANTFQIFSSSPRMWRAKPPDPAQVRLLKRERDRHDLTPLVVHDSYLINLASADPVIRQKSIEAFAGEIERALVIGAEYLVAHPGNYKNLTREQGLLNVAEGLALSWRAVGDGLKRGAKLTIFSKTRPAPATRSEPISAISRPSARWLDPIWTFPLVIVSIPVTATCPAGTSRRRADSLCSFVKRMILWASTMCL